MNGNVNLIQVPQGEIIPSELNREIALRLERTYKPPKKRDDQTKEQYENSIVLPADFPIVVELAMAQGHNPLSKTFHYWKQDGKIAVDDHYAMMLNWAQEKCPFNYTVHQATDGEKKDAGLDKEDCWAHFRAIRRADQDSYQDYVRLILEQAKGYGMPFEQALELAEKRADEKFAVLAEGVVKRNEYMYQDRQSKQWKVNSYATPKGWLPGVSRSESRAIRNGIRKMVGMPMPHERKRIGLDVTPQQLAQLPAEVMDERQEVVEHYLRLQAATEAAVIGREGLPIGEAEVMGKARVELMRGEVEDGEFEEPFTTEEILREALGKEAEFTVVVSDNEVVDEKEVASEPQEERTVTAEEVLQIALKCGYKEDGVKFALKEFFGKTEMDKLNDVELWNFAQYALRRRILNNTNAKPDERLSAIPEIVSAKDKPKTIKEAGPFMHQLLKTLTANGTKFNRLIVEVEE